jgi:hypothetical protein
MLEPMQMDPKDDLEAAEAVLSIAYAMASCDGNADSSRGYVFPTTYEWGTCYLPLRNCYAILLSGLPSLLEGPLGLVDL